MKQKDREILICEKTQDEGWGAVYERIMLGRLLGDLRKKYKIKSVLEYGAQITKGYDNLVFLSDCSVAITDQKIAQIQGQWRFKQKPAFLKIDKIGEKYDLVWNFALTQINPDLIKGMKEKSSRFVLIFTPNFLNYGTPIHLFLHLLAQTPCSHPERGSVKLRTLWGLKQFFLSKNLKIVEAGMVDIPFWPDFAFSLVEIGEIFGKKARRTRMTQQPAKVLYQKLEKATFIEKSRLPKIIKILFAHHIFVLGEIKR